VSLAAKFAILHAFGGIGRAFKRAMPPKIGNAALLRSAASLRQDRTATGVAQLIM